MEEELKGLMQRLGNAINRALSESTELTTAMDEIKHAGYEVKLTLEATVGIKGEDGVDAMIKLTQ